MWLAADRAWPPFVNQLVVEGEGEPDGAALTRALARIAQAWPAAGARLRGTLSATRWVADGRPPPLREAAAWDGVSPHPALSAPLDPWSGPVVELVRFPGRLLLRTHHAAFDGRAAWPLACDLGRLLRGEEPVGAQFAGIENPPTERPPASPPPSDAPLAVSGPAAGDEAPRWARRTLPSVPRELVARVAVALAVHRGERVRLSVPVDVRRAADPLAYAANLTGFVRLEAAPGEEVQEVAHRLRAGVAAGAALDGFHAADGLRSWPLWLLAPLARASALAQLRKGRAPTTGAISNLGRQDAAVFDHPGFRGTALYWLPPVSPGAGAFVTLTGHARGLELIVGLPDCLASGGRLDALADSLAAALAAGLSSAGE